MNLPALAEAATGPELTPAERIIATYATIAALCDRHGLTPPRAVSTFPSGIVQLRLPDEMPLCVDQWAAILGAEAPCAGITFESSGRRLVSYETQRGDWLGWRRVEVSTFLALANRPEVTE